MKKIKTGLSKAKLKATETIKKDGPQIMIIFGTIGMVSAVVEAVHGTTKASRILAKVKEEREEPLTKKDVVKETWKCYIPTALITVSSVICILCGNSKMVKRNAALSSAYILSESTLKSYRDNVKEVVGEKKASAIEQAVAKETHETYDPKKVILTDAGSTLIRDKFCNRYFRSDLERIRVAHRDLTERLYSNPFVDFVSVNDLYELLGVETTEMGEILGFTSETKIDIDYSNWEFAPNGEQCCILVMHPVADPMLIHR